MKTAVIGPSVKKVENFVCSSVSCWYQLIPVMMNKTTIMIIDEDGRGWTRMDEDG